MRRLITAPNKAAVTHVLRSPEGIERVTIRENLMALVMFLLTGCGTQEEVNDDWAVKPIFFFCFESSNASVCNGIILYEEWSKSTPGRLQRIPLTESQNGDSAKHTYLKNRRVMSDKHAYIYMKDTLFYQIFNYSRMCCASSSLLYMCETMTLLSYLAITVCS